MTEEEVWGSWQGSLAQESELALSWVSVATPGLCKQCKSIQNTTDWNNNIL